MHTEGVLIAKWHAVSEDNLQRVPDEVFWVDGTPASHGDYLAHHTDTQVLKMGDGGMELHMFPEIVGEASFDILSGHWAIKGTEIEPIALDLTNPMASDDQIIAELFTLPIVYRAHIIRHSPGEASIPVNQC